MIGKKFTSLTDGRLVEIRDIFEDIVILTDGSKTKASRLFDKNYFEEYIDPKNFFSNQYLLESFAQKIKQIPDEVLNKIQDSKDSNLSDDLDEDFRPKFSESAVLPADPELEKEELMRKYGIKNNSVQVEPPFIQAQKQLEQFKNLLQDIDEKEEERIETIIVDREKEFDEYNEQYEEEVVKKPIEKQVKSQPEDPIVSMFRNVKRNNDFVLTIDIHNKIPRSDFIEMMEDSYNTSIIDFLAEEFTNQILNNPEFIKNKIVEGIKEIVYPKKQEKKSEIQMNNNDTIKPTKARNTRQKNKEVSND